MITKHLKTAACALFALFTLGGCVTMPPVPADKNLLNSVVVTRNLSEARFYLKWENRPPALRRKGFSPTASAKMTTKDIFLMDRQVRWSNTKYSLILVFDDKGSDET